MKNPFYQSEQQMLIYIEYVKIQIEEKIEEYKAKLDLSTEK